jgi:hypothetical protein
MKREQPLVSPVDVTGMNVDELASKKQAVEEIVRMCADNAALAGSMPGQKLIKRLNADLDAIRKKYVSVRGSPDDQLAAFHRLQGREQQVSEELQNLTSASREQREMGLQIEALTFAIAEKKKDDGTR